MTLHTYNPQPNVPTKYQLPTLYSFQDIVRTRSYRSRPLWEGQRSNQGHTLHYTHITHTHVPTKYQLPTLYRFQDIARTRFYRSRPLREGQMSNQGQTMMLHTYNP